jgi:predicted  nucleic acid-binding Zn-ribbon protein
MPEFKLPNFNTLNADFEKATADLNNAVKEAAYVAVGLGVLGFQKAQVRRVELMKQVETQLASLSQLSGLTGQVGAQAEAYLKAVREQIAEAQAQIAKLTESIPGLTLPNDVPDAAAIREQFQGLAKSVDEAVAPVRQQFEEQLDRLEEVLPQAAREFVQTVRGAAATQEQQIRTVVGLV